MRTSYFLIITNILTNLMTNKKLDVNIPPFHDNKHSNINIKKQTNKLIEGEYLFHDKKQADM